uniref:dephospho-CoA kinase n=1 Tax=Ndongobacter massiliensis TaxID=1871025 RepID=UPI0009F81177|nr:dephospho-CoA kinase [Ndongobacter massiliensis]
MMQNNGSCDFGACRNGMPALVGLTGGIATGKSTATALLREMGYRVIDADQTAHRMMEAGGALAQAVGERFGSPYLRENGAVDRKKLAQLVFSDSTSRKVLDALAHPLIFRQLRTLLSTYEKDSTETPKKDILFLDIPLLFESNAQKQLPLCEVWLIDCAEAVQKERLCTRNDYTAAEAERRMRAQMPMAEKRKRAARIVLNNGDRSALKAALQATVATFLRERNYE